MVEAHVLQLSDTHLSRRHGYFVANWAEVLRRIDDPVPDLVVVSGDLSLNGSDDDDDLSFAIEQHNRIRAPWRVIAGNHDIGEESDAQMLGQPIDERRVNRWERLAGEHHWTVDIGRWRLAGVNGFLYGSGLPAEARQHEELTESLTSWTGPIGLFVHKPLFIDHPGEDSDGYHTFTAANRVPLLELITRTNVRFVASGHLHQSRISTWHDIRFVWAPSTAFPAAAPMAGANTALGWAAHRLSGDEHDVEIVTCSGLTSTDLAAYRDGGRYKFLYQTPPRPPDPADL